MFLIRVIDTETTGLDPMVDRIVEVATVDLIVPGPDETYEPPKRGRMWSSLVNPGIPIPPVASAVHDITDDMVAGSPTFAEVVPAILGEGMPNFLCAHNNRFDQKFLEPLISGIPWIDTYRVALWLWSDAPGHKNSILRYWLKLKLDPAIAEAPGMRSHRALWDAYVTAAILRRAILEDATILHMVDVSSKPAILPYFTFGKHAMKPLRDVDSSYLDWIMTVGDMEEDVRHTAFTELQRRRNHG